MYGTGYSFSPYHFIGCDKILKEFCVTLHCGQCFYALAHGEKSNSALPITDIQIGITKF
jgi:hypothetical protein